MHVMDWFDDSEDDHTSTIARNSRMRLYIVAVLIGFGALGLIGGVLHFLPA